MKSPVPYSQITNNSSRSDISVSYNPYTFSPKITLITYLLRLLVGKPNMYGLFEREEFVNSIWTVSDHLFLYQIIIMGGLTIIALIYSLNDGITLLVQ